MKKRILSLLLALLMVAGTFPASAAAGEAVDYSGDVGKYVKLNTAITEFAVYNEETGDTDPFYHEDFTDDTIFRIAEWMIKDENLWYCLEIYSGSVVGDYAALFPAEPWFKQTSANELVFLDTCATCGKPDCSGHDEPGDTCECGCETCTGAEGCTCGCDNCQFCQPKEPELPALTHPTGVEVTAESFPEGVTLAVQDVNAGLDSGFMWDIKISDDDKQWQPEAGETVKLKVPIPDVPDGEYIELLHMLEDENAIRAAIASGDVFTEEWVEDAFPAAAEAYYAVTGENGVAYELFTPIVNGGYATITTSSFSIYTWNGSSFTQTDTGDTLKIVYHATLTQGDASGTRYVTAGQTIRCDRGGKIVNDREWQTSADGTNFYYNTDHVSVTKTDGGAMDSSGSGANMEFTVDSNAPAGTTFWIRCRIYHETGFFNYQWSHWVTIKYIIVDEWTINFYNGNSKISSDTIVTGSGTMHDPISWPSNPSKSGYTFRGWSTANTGTSTINTSSWYPTQPTTNLYAVFTFDVAYNLNGGSGTSTTQRVNSNDSVTLHGAPTRSGYTFSGWSSSADSTVYSAGGAYSGKKATTMTAIWTANTYTLHYDANGGSVSPASKSVTYNSKYGSLATPTLEGYSFDGWYTAASGGTKVTADTVYQTADNSTVYAHWSPITYSVSFDGNGATSGSMTNQSFTFGTAQNLTANAYKREYAVTFNTDGGDAITPAIAKATFNGWEDRGVIIYKGTSYGYPDFDVPFYANNAKSTTWPNGDIWGNFGYDKYRIMQHYADHGKGEGRAIKGDTPWVYPNQAEVKNMSTTAGYVVPLYANWSLGSIMLPTPTKAGHEFEGWSDGTTTYAAGAVYTPTAHVTLTAQWTANTNTVTYQYTGTVPTGAPAVPEKVTKSYGDSVTVAVAPSLVGYTFSGWTTSDATVSDGKFTMPDKAVTLYGTWTLSTSTVTYQYTGTVPTGAPAVPEIVTKSYGDSVTVAVAPTLVGYTFSGWTTSDAAISGGKFTMPDKAVTLYGSWTARTDAAYTVHYYVEGCTTKLQDDKEVTGQTYGQVYTETAPGTIGNYILVGSSTQTVTAGYGNNEITFFYKLNQFTVSYAYTGSVPAGAPAAPTEAAVTVGSAVTVAETPTLTGYTFSGWTTSDAAISGGKFTMPGKAVALSGTWVPISYTITYDYADGITQNKVVSYTIENALVLEAEPTRDGYDFKGWKLETVTGTNWTAGSFNAAHTMGTGKYGDVTFVAQWERQTGDLRLTYAGSGPAIVTITGENLGITLVMDKSVTVADLPTGTFSVAVQGASATTAVTVSNASPRIEDGETTEVTVTVGNKDTGWFTGFSRKINKFNG